MEKVLEVKELSKQYTKVLAADKVSFDIEKGEIFALIGPNGAGKTTTIRMISTLLKPTSGDAIVAGHSVIKDAAKVRECITYLPDEAGAYKNMTGKSYLRFMAGLFSTDIDTINRYVERAERICGLGDRLKDKIGTYSRGMIRKLLLARAVMTEPKLAILDEPTSGLDPVARDELLDILSEYISDDSRSVLFSTHITSDVERIADYITVLHGGKVWFTGTKDELHEKYLVLRGAEEDISSSLREKCIGFHGYRNGFDALISADLLDEIPPELETEKASIDEILVYIAKEDSHEKRSENDEV